jgi:hypothetical protein
MDGTILGQGTFVASSLGLVNPNLGVASVGTANIAYLVIPSGVDWISVRNYTQAGTNGTSGAYFGVTANAYTGYEFFWQRGMAPGTGIVKYKSNTASTVNEDTLVSGGFTLYDPSGQTPGALPLLSAPVTTTAITNATRPVVSTASTAGLAVGSIVRLSTLNTSGMTPTEIIGPLAGVDFVVGAVTANTSFELLTASNPLANTVGTGFFTGYGSYRIVNYNPLFYPRVRRIVNITQAVNGQVSTSIPHGLTPGQEIRFNIPAVSGMIQLNPNPLNNYYPTGTSTPAIIQTVVDDYNFTININTLSYTAFTYPTVAQQPSSFPEVTPFGEDTATALASPTIQVPMIAGVQIYNTNTGILADSTVNTGFLGMILGIGGNGLALTTPIIGPAGSIAYAVTTNIPTPDTLYWVAGKSTYGGQ